MCHNSGLFVIHRHRHCYHARNVRAAQSRHARVVHTGARSNCDARNISVALYHRYRVRVHVLPAFASRPPVPGTDTANTLHSQAHCALMKRLTRWPLLRRGIVNPINGLSGSVAAHQAHAGKSCVACLVVTPASACDMSAFPPCWSGLLQVHSGVPDHSHRREGLL